MSIGVDSVVLTEVEKATIPRNFRGFQLDAGGCNSLLRGRLRLPAAEDFFSGNMLRWPAMATYLDESLAKLKEFEGYASWMYRDTVGRVAVGVALMLPNAGAAQALPFTLDGRAATQAEIGADFKRVMSLPSSRLPQFYRTAASPELLQETIDAKLRTVLIEFESEIRMRMKNYDGLSDGVKLALLDMAYNLGPDGLFREYPKMIKAIETSAWGQAAAASIRHGPSAARNTWTRAMFLSGAVVDSVCAEAEGWSKRLLRRIHRIFGR